MTDKETQEEKDKVGQKTSDFQIITELGRGSYGTVYKVVSIHNNLEYVMKKINIKHMKPKHQKEALKEAQILRKIKHQNIIKYYTSFMEKDVLYIIMEYADNGDLQQSIKEKKKKNQHFTEQEIWDMAWNLLASVEYLHKNNIIHRDIKTLNIFLTKDKKIKLGDLGVSKIVSSQMAQQATVVGTPLYLAPELVKQQPYDFKVDIWAIGCVLYHVAALEPPFQGDNLITLGFNIVHKNPKPLPGLYSGKLSNLINKFLEKNPHNRQSSREFLEKFPNKQAFINQDKIESEKQKEKEGKQMHYKDNTKETKKYDSNQRKSQGRIDVFDQQNLNGLISVKERIQIEKEKQQRELQPYNNRQQIYQNQKVKNDYNNINVKQKSKEKPELQIDYKSTKQQIQQMNQEKLNEIEKHQQMQLQQLQLKQQQNQQQYQNLKQQQGLINQHQNQQRLKQKQQEQNNLNKLFSSQSQSKYTNMVENNNNINQNNNSNQQAIEESKNQQKQNIVADLQQQDKDNIIEKITSIDKKNDKKQIKTEGNAKNSPKHNNFIQQAQQQIDFTKEKEKEKENKQQQLQQQQQQYPEHIRKQYKHNSQLQPSQTDKNFYKKDDNNLPTTSQIETYYQKISQTKEKENSPDKNNINNPNNHKFKIRPYSAQIKSKSYQNNNFQQKEVRDKQQELQKIENLVQNFKKVNEEYLNSNFNQKNQQNNRIQSAQQKNSNVVQNNQDYQLNNPNINSNNNTNKNINKQQQQKQQISQTPQSKALQKQSPPTKNLQPKTTQSAAVESFENKFQLNQQQKKTNHNQNQFQQQKYNKLPQRVHARPKSANVGGYNGFLSGGFKKQAGQSVRINPLFASPFQQNENSHKKVVTNYLKNTIGKMTLHQEQNPYESQNNLQGLVLGKKMSTIEPIKEVDELKIQANNYLNPKGKSNYQNNINNGQSKINNLYMKEQISQTNQNFYSNNINNNKQHTRPQTANVNSNRKKITLRDLVNN